MPHPRPVAIKRSEILKRVVVSVAQLIKMANFATIKYDEKQVKIKLFELSIKKSATELIFFVFFRWLNEKTILHLEKVVIFDMKLSFSYLCDCDVVA